MTQDTYGLCGLLPLSLIIWLSTRREDKRGLVLLPPHRDNTDGRPGSSADGGYMRYLLRGIADNDTTAQVVKCTPVIVLRRADEIMLFKKHPACTPPPPLGPSEDDMFCFSHLQTPTSTPNPYPWCISSQVGFRRSHKACLHDNGLRALIEGPDLFPA